MSKESEKVIMSSEGGIGFFAEIDVDDDAEKNSICDARGEVPDTESQLLDRGPCPPENGEIESECDSLMEEDEGEVTSFFST